jgi:rhodanese-related sulfurtransferase
MRSAGSNPIPEVSVETLAEKLRSRAQFALLDVREAWELESASIQDARLLNVSMAVLSQEGQRALPDSLQNKDAEILVICHHGVRSAQVVGWLTAKGWTRVFGVAGGIDEYARRVDPGVGSY